MDIIKNKEAEYKTFLENIKNCKLCRLHENRTKIVPGYGNINAKMMVVGEGPGADEDRQGIPFVGKAGQLLTKIFNAVKLDREKDMYITNVVKCRPPKNRDPEKDEIEICSAYLYFQIELIKPKLIVTLGNHSTHFFVDSPYGITKLRGQIFEWNGIKIIPMYHPSYVLRNYEDTSPTGPRRQTWEDIKLVRRIFDSLN